MNVIRGLLAGLFAGAMLGGVVYFVAGSSWNRSTDVPYSGVEWGSYTIACGTFFDPKAEPELVPASMPGPSGGRLASHAIEGRSCRTRLDATREGMLIVAAAITVVGGIVGAVKLRDAFEEA